MSDSDLVLLTIVLAGLILGAGALVYFICRYIKDNFIKNIVNTVFRNNK